MARMSNGAAGVDDAADATVSPSSRVTSRDSPVSADSSRIADGRRDRAVDGHDLAGPDQQPVAGATASMRHRLERAVHVAADVLRGAAEERRQLPVGPPLGVRLERLAGREHHRDDRGGEVLAEAAARRRWPGWR